MKTISQYLEEIKALMKKAADLDLKATTESRDPTEAELSLKKELLDKVEDTNKIVESLQRQEKLTAHLSEPPPAKTVDNSDTVITVGDNRATKDRFSSFGQQMAAVMRAGAPGGPTDPRLFNAATGLNETVPSDGGFLVQQDFSANLIAQVYETGILASRASRIPISGNSNSIKLNGVDETSRAAGSRGGGIRGYWADEADEKTKSKPKFRKIELTLKKLIGLCWATDELLEDAVALEAYISKGFVDEFGFQIDDAMVNGNGAGMPLGVMNAGCLVTQDKEVGQAATTVMAENVINMFARLFASSRSTAAWFINQNVEPQLHTMSIAVGTGGQLIYMPPGGLSQSAFGTLLGRPVIPIEQCQTLGTTGDIILGDYNNGYLLAEKGGIKSDMSIHVRFIYDESVFRFVLRIDGQPLRASAMTPYKGGAAHTQSHFVALQTRS
jgi:HK97 family phage major capsid protein